MIAGNSDRVFSRLMEVVGRTDLAERAAGRDRAQHEVELDAAITAWTSVRTAAEADALLAGAGSPPDRSSTRRPSPGTRSTALGTCSEPCSSSSTANRRRCPSPASYPAFPVRRGRALGRSDLGEHTDEVLTALTGTTAGQLQAHRDDGVI